MAALGNLGDSENAQSGSIGIGFAIPVDYTERIATELISTGTASHAWLGVRASTETNIRGARSSASQPAAPAQRQDSPMARW